MENYKAIVGSRSYGLEIKNSDYDIITTEQTILNSSLPNSHYIKLSKEDFLKRLLLLENDAYFVQMYFPNEILDDSNTSKYILEKREEILAANLDRIYTAYMKKANGLSTDLDKWYKKFPKRPAYSCLFYDTLYRYASKNISFQEAFKPEENFRQWLLDIRYGKIPQKDILMVNKELKTKAENVKNFYIGREDKVVLNKTVEDLNELLETNIKI